MSLKIMSNVSHRFARVPPSRKKVFKDNYEVPEDAVVRSGPFVIPKLEDTQFNSTSDGSIVAAGVREYPGSSMKAINNPIPNMDTPNLHFMNHYAPNDPRSWPSEIRKTPEEKYNTISFYIKDLKHLRPFGETDFFNGQNRKYKKVDSMYKALRAQILDYIKSKDGIVKRGGLTSESELRDLAQLDVPLQRILNGAEDFLNSMVLKQLNRNISNVDVDQPASLVEDDEPHRKIALERSPIGYNDTYGDDPEEDSPETQERVESLKNLPFGDGIYGHSTINGEIKVHKFVDHNKRIKDIGRLWAPRKKTYTMLSDNLVDKVTEVNYDPMELGDQDLSDVEVTDSGDDTGSLNLQDSKAVEKLGLEDEVLNNKIDQRICNALDLLKNALSCGVGVSEVVSHPSSSSTSTTLSFNDIPIETSTQEFFGGPSDPPIEEEVTCVDTTCPPSIHQSIPHDTTKMVTKEHLPARLVSKRSSTSNNIRKAVKPQMDSGTKPMKDIKKLNPTKPTFSKRTTTQKDSNRRNAIKIHMSKKRVKNTGDSDCLSEYEKVFGTKHSTSSVSNKNIKSKTAKVSRIIKPTHSKSS